MRWYRDGAARLGASMVVCPQAITLTKTVASLGGGLNIRAWACQMASTAFASESRTSL